MSDNSGKPFIATLYNVLFATGLCDQLFSNIMFIILKIPAFFIKCFAWCSLVITNKTWQPYRTTHSKNMSFWKKQRNNQNHDRKFLKRKYLCNYCIKDQDTGPQGHYWLEILQIFGKTLRSGCILTHYAHHIRYSQ